MTRNMWAVTMATIPVIAAITLGLLVLGGPGNQRLIAADLNTVRALGMIAQQIKINWQTSAKTLPDNLGKLSNPVMQNPLTGKPFVYRAKSSSLYELCATFPIDTRNLAATLEHNYWTHPKGDYCFQLDASQQVPQVPFSY